MVKVLFLGPFGRLQPEEDDDGYWNVKADGRTVAELVQTTEVANVKMNYSVLVNDVQQEQDYVMKDEEEIAILPLFHAG